MNCFNHSYISLHRNSSLYIRHTVRNIKRTWNACTGTLPTSKGSCWSQSVIFKGSEMPNTHSDEPPAYGLSTQRSSSWWLMGSIVNTQQHRTNFCSIIIQLQVFLSLKYLLWGSSAKKIGWWWACYLMSGTERGKPSSSPARVLCREWKPCRMATKGGVRWSVLALLEFLY